MEKKEKPPTFLLGLAVSATTEVLRLFNRNNKRRDVSSYDSIPRERDLTQVQDVVDALMVDYHQAYFLTGNVTSSLYSEDCFFADPTIGFTGRDLYERNLKLLVPFFEEPSLTLVSLNEESDEGRSIRAVWQLRTYLKLPWRPFICVDGSTVYTLDENLRIVRHIESWSISPLDAISQIFKRGGNPSYGAEDVARSGVGPGQSPSMPLGLVSTSSGWICIWVQARVVI